MDSSVKHQIDILAKRVGSDIAGFMFHKFDYIKECFVELPLPINTGSGHDPGMQFIMARNQLLEEKAKMKLYGKYIDYVLTPTTRKKVDIINTDFVTSNKAMDKMQQMGVMDSRKIINGEDSTVIIHREMRLRTTWRYKFDTVAREIESALKKIKYVSFEDPILN